MQHYGFARPTQDIDLLVEPSPDNIERVRQALCVLSDRAALEIEPTDVMHYSVVRVADEVLVDLIGSAGGVTYEDIADGIERDEAGIPYPRPEDLLRTKATVRPRDAMDRSFLERLIADESGR